MPGLLLLAKLITIAQLSPEICKFLHLNIQSPAIHVATPAARMCRTTLNYHAVYVQSELRVIAEGNKTTLHYSFKHRVHCSSHFCTITLVLKIQCLL